MIGWLRRLFRQRTPDRELAELSATHAERVAEVRPAVRRAHVVSQRIADGFAAADHAIYRGPERRRVPR